MADVAAAVTLIAAYAAAAIALIAAAATAVYATIDPICGRWRALNRHREASNGARADVTVLLQRQRAGSYTLDIINHGPGLARDIFVERPDSNAAHPATMLRTRLPTEIGRLYPGEHRSINLHTAGLGILEVNAVVHWNDRTGHRHRQFTVAG
ncbi:MAG: hypothetical protein AB7W59_24890 [Acidimicrobiia bacterium]